jgi:hypothetical protein
MRRPPAEKATETTWSGCDAGQRRLAIGGQGDGDDGRVMLQYGKRSARGDGPHPRHVVCASGDQPGTVAAKGGGHDVPVVAQRAGNEFAGPGIDDAGRPIALEHGEGPAPRIEADGANDP